LNLCLASAVLAVMRTPVLQMGRIGDVLHKYIPDFPPSSMYGQVRKVVSSPGTYQLKPQLFCCLLMAACCKSLVMK
jgi:hypothetical protein